MKHDDDLEGFFAPVSTLLMVLSAMLIGASIAKALPPIDLDDLPQCVQSATLETQESQDAGGQSQSQSKHSIQAREVR